MSEDISKILKMIEEGKITAEQGMELMRAIEGRGTDVNAEESGAGKGEEGMKASAFCIYVTDGEKEEVKVRIPKGLISCITKFVPKGMSGDVKTGETDIDISALLKDLENCTCGEVISVNRGGKKLKICCE